MVTETFCPICYVSVRGLHFHMAAEVLAQRAWMIDNREEDNMTEDSWYRFVYTVKVPRSEDRSLDGLAAEQELALNALADNPDSVEALEGEEWVAVHPFWELGPR
jgi:hypothetical protein